MVSKRDGLPRFNLKLSVEAHRQFKVLCAIEGKSMQQKLEEVIAEYIKQAWTDPKK